MKLQSRDLEAAESFFNQAPGRDMRSSRGHEAKRSNTRQILAGFASPPGLQHSIQLRWRRSAAAALLQQDHVLIGASGTRSMCMRSLGHIQRERQDLPGALVSYEQAQRLKRMHATDQLIRCCLQVCCLRNVLQMLP